ncbi:unnamed protein product [Dicrocoelium dendriticum]|nr:unnamed protein product [Dicrocoelium dendriticum]
MVCLASPARSAFKLDSETDCSLHRWFYDPRTMELTCVCTMHEVKSKDRKLMQDGDSRAILAIPEDRFNEHDNVGQGSFAYELNIWTTSDPEDTVVSLVSNLTPHVCYLYEAIV